MKEGGGLVVEENEDVGGDGEGPQQHEREQYDAVHVDILETNLVLLHGPETQDDDHDGNNVEQHQSC